jgi:type I restriction enzyme R subunit
MDNYDLKERDFEAYIEHWLTTEGDYMKGNQATYDKERAIDLKTLIKFLRLTQTKKWELYEKKYGVLTEDLLIPVENTSKL